MEGEFREAVVQRFVDEYAAGRTPNPCLECNRHVKFRHLVERAKLIGADCLATGHYARIERGDPAAGEPHRLLRAVDPKKDQSYVLYTLTQEQLGFIHFPLGGLHKTETRALARAFDRRWRRRRRARRSASWASVPMPTSSPSGGRT